MSEFEKTKAAGEKAEAFFEEYGRALLFPPGDTRTVFMLNRFQPEKGYYTNWPEHTEPDIPLVFEGIRKTDEKIHIEGADIEAYIIDPIQEGQVHGWIEVKSANDNAIIRYGADNNPSIPFEIYSNFQQKTPGWLWHLLHPDKSNELRKCSTNKLRALPPAALVFCQYEGPIGATPPYAVVSFYDFSTLQATLIEIAMERYGWDIIQWNLTSTTEEQKNRCRQEMVGANWNVCLKWLQDKGVPFVVYLLGNPPHIEHNRWYEQNISSWKKLQKMAAAHFELERLKGKHEELKIPDQEPKWDK